MFGRSTWKSEAIAAHGRAAKELEKYGILNKSFGGFINRIDGNDQGLKSSSSGSTESNESIKSRFILKKRSSQQFDDDHQEQYTLVVLGRFLWGVALTQGAYLILTYQSEWNPRVAALYTGIFGFIVAFGMAFSAAIRSVVYLIIPSLCTSKGRSIVMAFCLLVLMTGPAANIVHNYRQLSAALTCGDELGFNMTRGLSTLMQSEQNAILSSMDDTVDSIIEAVEEAEEIFVEFATKVQKVGGVIKKINEFLRNMGDICKKRLGVFFCIAPSFVAKQAKKFIAQPLFDAIATIKKEFYFKMSYKHDFIYEANVSKTANEITKDIMAEISETTGLALSLFDWIKFAMTFSSGFVVISALKYRYKYLTNAEFDNYFITNQFIKYDQKKEKEGKLPVLPLKAKEIIQFVRPGRIWMSRAELKKFAKGFSFLTINFLYTVMVLLIDYWFWRLLSFMTLSLSIHNQSKSLVQDLVNKGVTSVSHAAGLGTKAEDALQGMVGIAAQGAGFIAIIYRSIASGIEKIASAEGYDFRIDKCLPRARTPDYAVHTVILMLYAGLYVLCILEPYLLRIRRRIMASYYPKREKIRILYLRAKILSNRGVGPGAMASLLKKAILNTQQRKESEKIDYFAKYANRRGVIGVVARCITGRTVYRCNVCGLAGSEKDAGLFQRCNTFGCNGVYCKDCYVELHRMCMLCLVKERQNERRSQLGLRPKLTKRHQTELFIDSSGISDSSASSSEEEDSMDRSQTFISEESDPLFVANKQYLLIDDNSDSNDQ